MTFAVMWFLITLCLLRVIYVSWRDKNYSIFLGGILLLVWALYRVASYGGMLPPDLVLENKDYFPYMEW